MGYKTVSAIAQENQGLAKQAEEAKMFEDLGRTLVNRNEDNQKHMAGYNQGKQEAESMFTSFMNSWENSVQQPTPNEGLAADMAYDREQYRVNQLNQLNRGR